MAKWTEAERTYRRERFAPWFSHVRRRFSISCSAIANLSATTSRCLRAYELGETVAGSNKAFLIGRALAKKGAPGASPLFALTTAYAAPTLRLLRNLGVERPRLAVLAYCALPEYLFPSLDNAEIRGEQLADHLEGVLLTAFEEIDVNMLDSAWDADPPTPGRGASLKAIRAWNSASVAIELAREQETQNPQIAMADGWWAMMRWAYGTHTETFAANSFRLADYLRDPRDEAKFDVAFGAADDLALNFTRGSNHGSSK